MVDPSVVAALRAGLEADPGNDELRAYLASVLLDHGDPAGALAEARTVLGHRPDHVGALATAAAAARTLGDADAAASYQRVHDALAGPAAAPAAPPAPPAPSAAPPASPPASLPPPMPSTGPAAPMPSFEEQVPDTADELMAAWGEVDAPEEPEVGHLHRPTITLADVGGLQAVKDRLVQSFLAPMQNPELRAHFGKSLRGGLMLWGPPGCGKTFLARAVAGELGAAFYEVGIADVLDMWIGSSERNLHAVFEVARANRPCVLFFDEIDALGHKRTQLRGGGAAMRGVVNQLLAELDGVSSNNEGVFVLAATNHPWDVDPALLRPGRIDRTLLVLPPDEPARQAILATHLAGRPTEGVDLAPLARSTDGRSGADLALVCEQAAEAALAASIQSGTVQPIRQEDLARAIRLTRPSNRPWFEAARHHAMYADAGGDYAELLAYLQRRP